VSLHKEKLFSGTRHRLFLDRNLAGSPHVLLQKKLHLGRRRHNFHGKMVRQFLSLLINYKLETGNYKLQITNWKLVPSLPNF
jgi:hypothetical protein